MKIERETIVRIELSQSEAGDLRAILGVLFDIYEVTENQLLEKYHLTSEQALTIKNFQRGLYE